MVLVRTCVSGQQIWKDPNWEWFRVFKRWSSNAHTCAIETDVTINPEVAFIWTPRSSVSEEADEFIIIGLFKQSVHLNVDDASPLPLIVQKFSTKFFKTCAGRERFCLALMSRLARRCQGKIYFFVCVCVCLAHVLFPQVEVARQLCSLTLPFFKRYTVHPPVCYAT